MKTKQQGLIYVFTGNGKGKTSAAVGLAARARAYAKKVCFIGFHKNPGPRPAAEYKSMQKLGIERYFFAKQHPAMRGKNNRCSRTRLSAECKKGVDFIRKMFKENKYDVMVLDEILICVRDRFLDEEDVLGLLEEKPPKLELVLTGRGLSPRIKRKADLVSEVKEVKHPFQKGIPARQGIDF